MYMKNNKSPFLAVICLLLSVVSCSKTEIQKEPKAQNEIGLFAYLDGFKPSKADPELSGSSLGTDNDYVIYVAASAEGSPKYFDPDAASFGGHLFAYFTDGAKWFPAAGSGPYTKQHIYWPFGGVKVDFLACALTPAAKDALSPTFHSDTHAREFKITNWNTFANQFDVMYAVANGCVPGTDGNVALAFKHTQALLAFTAKKSATTTVDLTINKITIRDLEYQGTLTVDNYRANLNTYWTITAHADKDLSSAEGIADFPYTLNSTATQLTTNLLIPEQSAKQIVINYSMGGKTFDYELNIPRTIWKMGKKYIFNLEFSAAEVTLTTSVEDWGEIVDNEQIG